MSQPVIGRLRRWAGAHGPVAARRPAAAAGADAGPEAAEEPRAPAPEPPGDIPTNLFVNPVGEGADPCVVRDDGRYLWCQSEGNVAISVWVSPRLTSLGRKHVVWVAPQTGPVSRQVWAPELVKLDDRWYIYFAASDGENRNHLSYVLVSRDADPLGPYELTGPLFTGDRPGGENLWSIDLTVLERGERRYAVWSGWPDARQDLQHLYIAEMASPTQLTGRRVRIAEAGAYVWERVHETPPSRGLLEGPQVLLRGGRTFLVYSCAASWLPTYKLGMLELTGDDPLDLRAWTRHPEPVFVGSDSTYGVGHGSFVLSPDDREWWHVFHAKVDRRDGWRRAVHVQAMSWSDDGTPRLGTALPPRHLQPFPAGTGQRLNQGPARWDLTRPEALAEFDYYGHHQFFSERGDGLHLGLVPEVPVNAYRSGEKLVLRDGWYDDLELTARFRFVQDHRAAGVIFRTTGAGVGFDAQHGYFAGIARDRDALVLGKTDGARFTSLAEVPIDIDVSAEQSITVTAAGDSLRVSSGDTVIDVRDSSYARGSVGLRVVDTHTCFTEMSVQPGP